MLLGFLATVSYVPGWTGNDINTVWVVLSIVMPFYLYNARIEFSNAMLFFILFMLYAILSLIWTPDQNRAIEALWHLFIISCVFLYANSLQSLRKIIIGMAIGLSISAVVAIAQKYGWHGIPEQADLHRGDTHAGIFYNEMIFAWVSAFIAIALYQERLFYWLPICLPGLLLTNQRAPVLIFGAALLWKTKNVYLMFAVVAAIVALIFVRPGSVMERLLLWRDIVTNLTFFGHGIGSFESLMIGFFHDPTRRPDYAENDALQYLFEYGVGTIPLIAAVYAMRANVSLLCAAAIVFIAAAPPLYVPTTAFLCAMAMGHCTRFRRDNGLAGIHGGSSQCLWLQNIERRFRFTRRKNIPVQ